MSGASGWYVQVLVCLGCATDIAEPYQCRCGGFVFVTDAERADSRLAEIARRRLGQP